MRLFVLSQWRRDLEDVRVHAGEGQSNVVRGGGSWDWEQPAWGTSGRGFSLCAPLFPQLGDGEYDDDGSLPGLLGVTGGKPSEHCPLGIRAQYTLTVITAIRSSTRALKSLAGREEPPRMLVKTRICGP